MPKTDGILKKLLIVASLLVLPVNTSAQNVDVKSSKPSSNILILKCNTVTTVSGPKGRSEIPSKREIMINFSEKTTGFENALGYSKIEFDDMFIRWTEQLPTTPKSSKKYEINRYTGTLNIIWLGDKDVYSTEEGTCSPATERKF